MLGKSSIVRRTVSASVVFLTLVFPPSALGQSPDEALKSILDGVDRMCTRISTDGSRSALQIEGEIGIEFAKIVKSLADLGIGTSGSYSEESYSNLTRPELARAIQRSDDCRREAFKLIRPLFQIDQRSQAEPAWSLPPVSSMAGPTLGEACGDPSVLSLGEARDAYELGLRYLTMDSKSETVENLKTAIPKLCDAAFSLPGYGSRLETALAYHRLGYSLLRLGEESGRGDSYRAAAESFESASLYFVRTDGDWGWTYNDLGRAYLKLGDHLGDAPAYARAVASFRQVVDIEALEEATDWSRLGLVEAAIKLHRNSPSDNLVKLAADQCGNFNIAQAREYAARYCEEAKRQL